MAANKAVEYLLAAESHRERAQEYWIKGDETRYRRFMEESNNCALLAAASAVIREGKVSHNAGS